jgi:hypothetical protein
MTILVKLFVGEEEYKSKKELLIDLVIPFWMWIRTIFRKIKEIGK